MSLDFQTAFKYKWAPRWIDPRKKMPEPTFPEFKINLHFEMLDGADTLVRAYKGNLFLGMGITHLSPVDPYNEWEGYRLAIRNLVHNDYFLGNVLQEIYSKHKGGFMLIEDEKMKKKEGVSAYIQKLIWQNARITLKLVHAEYNKMFDQPAPETVGELSEA